MKTYHNNYYNPELREFARELRTQSVSKAERRIWKVLLSRKQAGTRFLRQRPIDRFIVDFFAPDIGLIIEIDGNSHYKTPEYDRYRQDRLLGLGYQMLRFTEGEVMNQLDDLVPRVMHAVYSLKEGKGNDQ